MERYDVIVVGGGPAGSSCAHELVSNGLRVRVLDKAVFPRPKPCAGWISPDVFTALYLSPESYGDGRTLQPFSAMRFWDGMERPQHFEYGRTIGYGIRRCEFDAYLLGRSGAAVETGVHVRSFERTRTGVKINGVYEAPMVAGAGGHACPIARALGECVSDAAVVTAVESETLLPESAARNLPTRDGAPEIIFCDDFRGYGWIFQKQNALNIGIGRTRAGGLTQKKDELLRKLVERGRLPKDIAGSLAPFRGHLYTVRKFSSRNPVSDRVLLAGDAAGLAYNVSGEGIRPAIVSGLLAARAILRAEEDYSAENLAGYADDIRRTFGVPYSASILSLTSIMPSLPSMLGGLVLRSKRLTELAFVRRSFLRENNGLGIGVRDGWGAQ